MELVNSLLSKIGLKKRVPLFFKSGWIISIFYTFILIIIIHTLWAHRHPRRMALYLILLFGVTIVLGLIFEKRAFCNYACPVGHLLGLYALCSPLEWRAKDQMVCKECQTKDCIAPKNYYTLKRRSCTSNLYPAAIKDNRRCLLCTHCLKVCPYGNLRLSLRRPMGDFFRSIRLNNAELFFIFVVSGFVIHEIYVEWAAAKRFSLLILPVMAAEHIMKSLFKVTSRIPYYKYLSGEPLGWDTAHLISSGQIQLDKGFITFISPFLSLVAVFLFVGTLVFSSVLLWRDNESKLKSIGAKLSLHAGLIIYAFIYIVMIILWRF